MTSPETPSRAATHRLGLASVLILAGVLLLAFFPVRFSSVQPPPAPDVTLGQALIAFKTSDRNSLSIAELRAQLRADWDTVCTTVYWDRNDNRTPTSRTLGQIRRDYAWPFDDGSGAESFWFTLKNQSLRSAVKFRRDEFDVLGQDSRGTWRGASVCVAAEQGRLVKVASPVGDVKIHIEVGGRTSN